MQVLGTNTLKKLQSTKVYMVGISSLSCEVVKLLALCRLDLLTIFPWKERTEEDMLTQEKSTHWTRMEDIRKILKGTSYKFDKEYSSEEVARHDVLLVCGCYDITSLALGKVRNANVKIAIIMGMTAGLSGIILSDYSLHKVYNDGGECKQYAIKHISRSSPGIVQTAEPHSFRTGDFIRIDQVEGMTHVNGTDCRPVRVLSPYQF